MVRHNIYYAVTATGNALATLVFPGPFRLRMVILSWACSFKADGVVLFAEISRSSICNFTTQTNDQCVGRLLLGSGFVTSGLQAGGDGIVIPCDDQFQTGQALYLNAVQIGTGTTYFGAQIIGN